MTLEELIKAVNAKFPDASREDIAAAFQLSIDATKRLVARTKIRPASRKRMAVRDPQTADKIERFANEYCKGKVEVISIPREGPALCINGRLVA